VLAAALYLGGMLQNSRASADALSAGTLAAPQAGAPDAARDPQSPVAGTLPPAGEALVKPAGQPPAPAPNTQGRYSVLVGSFRQPGEADRLIEQLQEHGYEARTRRIDTGERGVWHQVVAGPYIAVGEARQAEARIRQLPGYADARLISR
jgi:cell division septation protein DedD